MKSFLFVMQSASFQGTKIQEVLDQVLITAAFDQQVSLLFIDDAVYQLLKNQDCLQICGKDISAIYLSLDLYDIKQIYVEQESLAQRGLSSDQLIIPVNELSRQEVGATIKLFDVLISA